MLVDAAAIHGSACPARETISVPGHRVLAGGRWISDGELRGAQNRLRIQEHAQYGFAHKSRRRNSAHDGSRLADRIDHEPDPAPPARPVMFSQTRISLLHLDLIPSRLGCRLGSI